MRTTLAVTALALTAFPAAPAGAVASGVLCGYTSPSASVDGRYVVEVDGGPLAVDDLAASGDATLTCTLQRWYDGRHADPDLAAVSSVPAPRVAVLAPTPVVVAGERNETFVLCTELAVAGAGTYYWHVTDDGTPGEWRTDPAARCAPAPSWVGPPPPDLVGEARALLEGVLCPVVATVHPDPDRPLC
jgi:hypothetical protein